MASDNTGRKRKGGPPETLFSPGNPGRPKGARNRVSVAVERMLEADGEAVAAVALRLAKAGDATLIRAVLDRIAPPRREPTVSIDLPLITSPADAPVIAARLIEAVAAGELTPAEAQGLAALLESYRRQSELADLESRIAALESRQP